MVVTNQPDAVRGTQERAVVESMNGELARLMDIDEFGVCYHDVAQACECRKPKTGLLLAAAKEWPIDLRKSFMAGDRWRDVDAGIAAGCRTVFVDGEYHEGKINRADFTANSLRQAADWILGL